MECVLLVAVATTVPVAGAVSLIVSKKLDWGWALLGGIVASLLLTNALAGSILTEAEWARITQQVGSDQFGFLGKWLGALATVCSPLLTVLGLGAGGGIGVAIGEQAK